MFVVSNLGFSWNHPVRKFFRKRGDDPTLTTIGVSMYALGSGLMTSALFIFLAVAFLGLDPVKDGYGKPIFLMCLAGLVIGVIGLRLYGNFEGQLKNLVAHLGEGYDIETLTRTDLVPLEILARVRLIDLAGRLMIIEEATVGLPYHKSRVDAKAKFEACYSFFEHLGLTHGDGYGRYFEPSKYAWD